MMQARVVVVTGGGRNLGLAYAERFLRAGAKVVIAELDGERGAAAQRRLEQIGEALFIQTDITDGESVARCVAAIERRFGRLDVLVNNAAMAIAGNPAPGDRSDEQFERLFQVNLFGAFRMARAAAPLMACNRWGRILNVGSEAQFLASGRAAPAPPPAADATFPGLFPTDFDWTVAVYGWAKNGLGHLTRMLARELGPWGINVNLVVPGPTATESYIRVRGLEDLQRKAQEVPLRRVTTVQDQVETALFLCSDAAAAITGQTLCVDGGAHFIG
jgi:NAD(P)-dependent dehydrogenase (short-subunit alcohol dehydrogenase family)